MNPFRTILFITLHPFPSHLFHTNRTVGIILKTLRTFRTKNVPLVNYIFLILQLVWTHSTFQTILTSVFALLSINRCRSLQTTTNWVKQMMAYVAFQIIATHRHLALKTRRTLLTLPHSLVIISHVNVKTYLLYLCVIMPLMMTSVNWRTLLMTKFQTKLTSIARKLVHSIVTVDAPHIFCDCPPQIIFWISQP